MAERTGRGAEPSFYASQLARFDAASLASSGTAGSEGLRGVLPRLGLVPARPDEPGEKVLSLELGHGLPQGASLEILLRRGEDLAGLLLVRLGPRSDPSIRISAQDGSLDRLPADLRLQIAFVDSTPPRTDDGQLLERQHWSWRRYGMERSVAELP